MIGYREGKCILCGKDGILNEGICERHSAEVAQAFLFGIEEGMKLAPSAWQPMETAPKDGTLVNLWSVDPMEGNRPRLWQSCRWIDHDGQKGHPYGWYQHVEGLGAQFLPGLTMFRLTAWMPLPPPPSSEKL